MQVSYLTTKAKALNAGTNLYMKECMERGTIWDRKYRVLKIDILKGNSRLRLRLKILRSRNT